MIYYKEDYGIKTNKIRKFGLKLLFYCIGLFCLFVGKGWSQVEKPKNRPYADYRHFHLGFYVGIHTQDLVIFNKGQNKSLDKLPIYGEMPYFSPGFSVGIIANYSPFLNLDLKIIPSLHLGERTIAFANESQEHQNSFSLRSNMLELPIMIKYSSRRLNNIRPYVTGGVYGSLMIGQKVSSAIRFKLFDYGLKIGIGCDFYLKYFKLCPELTFGYGIPNVLEKNRPDLIEDPHRIYTQTLQKVSTRMFLLTINFE